MAHFAKLGESNIVLAVHTVNNSVLLNENGIEQEALGVAFLAGLHGHAHWKQTSYNGNTRKNYAGIGYTYDPDRDAFIPPQPFASWGLDEETCQWVAPVPYPESGGPYTWNEFEGTWVGL